MKLNFKINYRTIWGESLGVMIADQVVELSTSDGEIWAGSADIELPKGGLPLLYRYGVWRDGQCIRKEQNTMAHVIENVSPNKKSLDLDDCWRDARRVAGVHSESEVREEEVTATGYKATVVGKNGLLIITLGDKTISAATGSNAWLAENHYEKLASGNGYAMWVQHTADVAARLMATPECSFSDAQNGIKVGMKAIGAVSEKLGIPALPLFITPRTERSRPRLRRCIATR